MLDLKSKLAAAGLVTQKDIDRVDKGKAGGKKKKSRRGDRGAGGGKGGNAGAGRGGPPRLAVGPLRGKSKGEQYDAVRRFMERVRLYDPARAPTEEAQTFHFATAKGQIGRLMLEPDVLGWVREGTAGVVAYMSNHGLAHTVVPAAAAREVAELFPLWLRVLEGHPEAGRLEAEVEAEGEAEGEAAAKGEDPPKGEAAPKGEDPPTGEAAPKGEDPAAGGDTGG